MKLSNLFKQEDRTAIEKWCRSHVQQAYLGEHTALCRVLGQFLMYVDTRDLSLTPHLMMNGYWEMWVTQAIANYVKPGMRCIDVGANVGYYTLLLADLVGEKGRVVAYEPQKNLTELLARSLVINGLASRGIVHRVAIGAERQDSVTLHSIEGFMGSASLSLVPMLNGDPGFTFKRTTSETRVMTLAPQHERVDFVKIDVQGHEMQVLEGMRDLIDRSPGIAIAMEFTPSEHGDPLAALQVIQSYGLKIETIGTDGVVRPVPLSEAAAPDTGDHRMLWLTRTKNLTPPPDPT